MIFVVEKQIAKSAQKEDIRGQFEEELLNRIQWNFLSL